LRISSPRKRNNVLCVRQWWPSIPSFPRSSPSPMASQDSPFFPDVEICSPSVLSPCSRHHHGAATTCRNSKFQIRAVLPFFFQKFKSAPSISTPDKFHTPTPTRPFFQHDLSVLLQNSQSNVLSTRQNSQNSQSNILSTLFSVRGTLIYFFTTGYFFIFPTVTRAIFVRDITVSLFRPCVFFVAIFCSRPPSLSPSSHHVFCSLAACHLR